VKPLPFFKTCFLCAQGFLAEWARSRATPLWHVSEICPACEHKLRREAA
jgi:hypothetical protein